MHTCSLVNNYLCLFAVPPKYIRSWMQLVVCVDVTCQKVLKVLIKVFMAYLLRNSSEPITYCHQVGAAVCGSLTQGLHVWTLLRTTNWTFQMFPTTTSASRGEKCFSLLATFPLCIKYFFLFSHSNWRLLHHFSYTSIQIWFLRITR